MRTLKGHAYQGGGHALIGHGLTDTVSAIASVIANSTSTAFWLDGSALDTLWQDSAKTTAVASDGDPVGAWEPSKGAGTIQQSSGASRPSWASAGGVAFDADVEHLLISLPSRVASHFFMCVLETNDITAMICQASGDAARYFGALQNGSTGPIQGTVGTPTFKVNKTTVTNRQQMYDNISGQGKVIFTAQSLDTRAAQWASVDLGRYNASGFGLNGTIYEVMMSDDPGAQYDAILAEVASRHGITL